VQPLTHRNLFFRCSREAFAEVTRLYDFLWPTTAAMWNLRWQVQGFLQVCPDATPEELCQRFAAGSEGDRGNIRRACQEQTWDDQRCTFARVLLVNLCAVYESWTAQVLTVLGARCKAKEDDLQYPDLTTRGKRRGVSAAITAITAAESPVIKASIYPSLQRNERYALKHIQALMLCYRYFKECRNTFIHQNGIPDQRTENAFAAFRTVATTAQLGMKEVPEHYPIDQQHAVQISLRGVVGFSDVILRLIATLDIELSRAAMAERELIAQWRATHPERPCLSSLRQDKRDRRLSNHFRHMGLPTPTALEGLLQFLLRKGLIS